MSDGNLIEDKEPKIVENIRWMNHELPNTLPFTSNCYRVIIRDQKEDIVIVPFVIVLTRNNKCVTCSCSPSSTCTTLSDSKSAFVPQFISYIKAYSFSIVYTIDSPNYIM